MTKPDQKPQPLKPQSLPSHSWPHRIMMMLILTPIYAYKMLISPLLGANCRFSPSCSSYAIEAIQLHGILKGGYLSAQRIRKCHPFGGSGYDPVPKHNHEDWK